MKLSQRGNGIQNMLAALPTLKLLGIDDRPAGERNCLFVGVDLGRVALCLEEEVRRHLEITGSLREEGQFRSYNRGLFLMET